MPREAFRLPVEAKARPLPVARPRAIEKAEPSYYDVSILQAPVWKWEIATYFFFGGLSGGSYVLARVLSRRGGARARRTARAAAAIAAATSLPCAPLLIKDLGDPKRFHHMLRVFKPSTPMNLGTWVISVYTPLTLLETWLAWRGRGETAWRRAGDALGLPLGVMMTTYTAVLISSTSTPLWRRSQWLSPLFAASSFASAAGALSLSGAVTGTQKREDRAHRAVALLDTVAHLAEAASLAGFVVEKGELAAPLVRGRMAKAFWIAAGGILLSEAIKHSGPPGRARSALSALAGLAGAYALRWGMVHAGPPSALDPSAARRATGTKRPPRVATEPPARIER